MKKFTSMLLIVMMAISLVSVSVFTTSAEDLEIIMYGTGMENWSGQTQLLIQADMPESLIGDTTTPWDITFTWDGGSKTVTQTSTSHYRWKAGEPKTIQRFQIVCADKENQFIPEVGVEYKVSATVTKDDVTYNFSTPEDKVFTLDVDPIIPDEYNYPEDTAEEIEIIMYGTGMENWSNQTQLLIQANMPESLIGDTTTPWTITFTWDGGSKTVTQTSTSHYRWKAGEPKTIQRFQIVCADEANQFIPEVGVEYKVSATVTKDGATYNFSTPEDKVFTMGVDPIIPDEFNYGTAEPEIPEVVISPYDPEGLKGWENWNDGADDPDDGVQTQLLICTTADVPMDATWKLTITDGTTTKTITLKATTGYADWLRRFEVCLAEGENQFVPVNGAAYTISAEIYNEAGELIFVAPAATGFDCALDAIVPSVEPEPTPTPTPTPTPDVPPTEEEPPVDTGDATVYAIVFAVVALMGMAVVITKKVRA